MASKLQKIKLIPNPKYKHSGPKSYVYLLRKYHIAPTLDGPYHVGGGVHHQGKYGVGRLIGGKSRVQYSLQKRDASGKVGEVTAEDQQNDSLYLCPITIGTPAQTFNVDFDTGSADLWLFSTELPASTVKSAGNSHHIYDSKKSDSFQLTKNAKWKISYGDGSSASGIVGTDNVNIGGLVIENQTIELANQLSPEFASGVGDGLLGLSFSSINTVKPGPAHTPVDNMISQSDIPHDQELFTAYLGSLKDINAPDKGESFYTFGYIDKTVLEAAGVTEPYYTPVDKSQGFWMFNSTSATVNGNTVARDGNTAIADTGTTLALIDDATCKAIYDAIPGATYDSQQQGYVFPANVTADQLPVVTFAVGDKQFSIGKEDLAFADTGNGNFYGGIQSRGNLGFDILGDTFLKGIYAIFDQGNTRFGAVQRADQTPPALSAQN